MNRMKTGESKLRSFTKSISWRILATSITVIISAFFVSAPIALSIGAIEFFVKWIAYYLHERGWSWVSWGRLGNDVEEENGKLFNGVIENCESDGKCN